jgi:hypothetical protein
MSRHSAKSAGRSAKTSRASAKKPTKAPAKSARGTKKASKSARQPVGKSTSKAVAAKSAAKTQSARKTAPVAAPVAPQPEPILRTASPPMQPIVVPDVPMRAHKYGVGETVYYTSPSFGRAAASGSYTVVKLLPSDGEDYQYRIKSSGEAFERVAKESQLDRA